MFLTSDYALAGLAAVGGTYFTNPFEVIKTRIQLQGELSEPGTYATPYRSVLGAFRTVAKNEGYQGLQKGVAPACVFSFLYNGWRFGLYNKAVDHGWASKDGQKNAQISFVRSAFLGGIGSVVGALISSPFFLVKTQLQAQAPQTIAVGYQHEHESMMHAFKEIYGKSGLFGLWNGCAAAIPRALIGGSFQIATFGWTKSKLKELGWVTKPAWVSFCAGLLAGSVLTVVITPPDVITTRLYNQHHEKRLYNGYMDCLMKTLKTEGIAGLYKGFWPNYLRFAPHSTLSLLFFDELLALRKRYEERYQ